jgi:hypothetical protein
VRGKVWLGAWRWCVPPAIPDRCRGWSFGQYTWRSLASQEGETGCGTGPGHGPVPVTK